MRGRAWIRRLLLLVALAAPAAAEDAEPLPLPTEEVVGALSQNRVSITASFTGSRIFVFGAVKRTAPVPDDAGPLGVVVTVAGPSEPVTVRRKERVAGIWVNRDEVVIDEAPSFYAVATTGPLDEIMSATEQLRHRIGFDQVVRAVGARAMAADPENFVDAVVRIRERDNLYASLEGAVSLREETLFSTDIGLPANLVEGDYAVRMFLLRDGAVVNVAETEIRVRKVGLEALIYNTAHERPLVYGLISIGVALLAGWLASEAFRLLRR